jgi:hypothetical protein
VIYVDHCLKVSYVLGVDVAPAARPQITKFLANVPLPLILTGVWQSSGGVITAPPAADGCPVSSLDLGKLAAVLMHTVAVSLHLEFLTHGQQPCTLM